ncbi:hypothetical protein BKA93DRAFT_739447 [Sparassis latifolia]
MTANIRDEMVLYIQGYVWKRMLPPVTRHNQLPTHIISAKQSISLAGLGAKSFDNGIKAIINLHQLMSERVNRATLTPWTPRRIQNEVLLDFSNRYFSSPKDAVGEEAIEFGIETDPFGILKNQIEGYIHTTDNKVLYYERSTLDEHGKSRTLPIQPAAIQIGHMVELQVSFCAVPISKGKYRFLHKLRSICVLNRRVQLVSGMLFQDADHHN